MIYPSRHSILSHRQEKYGHRSHRSCPRLKILHELFINSLITLLFTFYFYFSVQPRRLGRHLFVETGRLVSYRCTFRIIPTSSPMLRRVGDYWYPFSLPFLNSDLRLSYLSLQISTNYLKERTRFKSINPLYIHNIS